MARTCPPALLAHFSSSASTPAYLLKIGPLPVSGDFICCTSLDRPVDYDDASGDGELTYHARTGVQLSNLGSSIGGGVENSEAQTLVELATYPNTGITEAMIDGGRLDSVPFVIYKVNYKDLSMGHMILTGGPVGEVRRDIGGLIILELRSWTDLLRQNSVCELDSLTCRVRHFGSQPGEERFPCMYDATGEWIEDVTVSSLGADPYREFAVSTLDQADDYFAPGLWEWTAGDNVGTTKEIEAFAATGDSPDFRSITLQFSTRFPVQIGDVGRLRRDCTRQWAGHNSCETYANRPYFRGEPFIPAGDQIALTVPLAGSGGASV